MGIPNWLTCTYIQTQQIALPNQDPLFGPGSTRLISFLGPGSSRPPPSNPPNPNVEPNLTLPKTWIPSSSAPKGDCIVTMTTVDIPGPENYDRATFRDVFEAVTMIREASLFLGHAYTGGVAEFGERNALALFVYAGDSEFARRLDRENGCIRKGGDRERMLKGVRVCGLDTIEEGEEGEVHGGDGDEDSGYNVMAEGSRQCSSAPLGAGALEVLYGLKGAVGEMREWIVRNCRGVIWDVGIK
ncbi:MAG: hypothetical protein M1812_003264 [Candelaria pacifica]|nr:MAG: hypothetical protein M1812_003264 [Candelaria pacifica]